METLVNTGMRSMKPSPASNHLAGSGLGTADGARANSRAPFLRSAHPIRSCLPLLCPGTAGRCGLGFTRSSARRVGRVPPAAEDGRRCGEPAGGWGAGGRACRARRSGRVLTRSLIPSSAWKPGLLAPGAFGLAASCCA